MIKKLAAVAALALLGACSSAKTDTPAAQSASQPLPPFLFVQEVAGAEIVGQGQLGYRFALLQPNGNRLAENTPFALTHSSVKVPGSNAKNVYQGITNERGLTPVFAFAQGVPEEGWILLPRVGEGANGLWFTLSSPQQQLLSGVPYSIAVCAAQAYWVHGQSNSRGQTAYIATAVETPLRLYPYSDDAAVQQERLKTCPPLKAEPKGKAARKTVKGKR